MQHFSSQAFPPARLPLWVHLAWEDADNGERRMTDAAHARRQIETGRGENGSLKGKKMSVHAHTHTKTGETKERGTSERSRAGENHPSCLGRAVCSSILCCFVRSIRDASALVNQNPDTSPFDKYLSCLALYHFSFHQINLDSSNRKTR